ncbi:MAG TPA: SRPBCC family protein [Bacteroidia bacterium]|nr:SRPBCC family protein [Bacteroidia bacterium]
MSIIQLHFTQKIPVPVETAWDYFSDPKNLSKITPPEMNFRITSEIAKPKTYAGQMIAYTLTPMLGIRIGWLTEITQVNAPYFFVDEQRKGPYKIWHHEHEFSEISGGVEMTDRLTYEIPLGFIGDLMNSMMIRKRIEGIFEYRKNVLEKTFGSMK